MLKSPQISHPDDYHAAFRGWRRKHVEGLRKTVLGSRKLKEALKWGHLVFSANGPVLLIRVEDHRVLFGFWRGQRLRDIEPRLKPGGKYLGYVRLVGRRRMDTQLEEPVVSIPAHYEKQPLLRSQSP